MAGSQNQGTKPDVLYRKTQICGSCGFEENTRFHCWPLIREMGFCSNLCWDGWPTQLSPILAKNGLVVASRKVRKRLWKLILVNTPNITWIDCLPNFEYFPWLVMYFRSLNPKSILPALSGWLKFKISSYHARGRCSKTEIRIQIEQSEFWHLDLNICVCTKQIFLVSSPHLLEIKKVYLL